MGTNGLTITLLLMPTLWVEQTPQLWMIFFPSWLLLDIIITSGNLEVHLMITSQGLVHMSMLMEMMLSDGVFSLISRTTTHPAMSLATLLLASLMMAVLGKACVIRSSGDSLLTIINIIMQYKYFIYDTCQDI